MKYSKNNSLLEKSIISERTVLLCKQKKTYYMTNEVAAWEKIQELIAQRFDKTKEEVDIQSILFIIGVQETGVQFKHYNKDDKVNLIHVGTCMVLAELGFYSFTHRDEQGWPHFELKESIPANSAGEQTLLVKKGILSYFGY